VLPFKEQDRLIEDAVAWLLSEDLCRSACFEVPPCFGEDNFAQLLARRIQVSSPRAAIAVVHADMVTSRERYVDRLHQEWSAWTPLPPAPKGTMVLEQFLHSLPRDRPFVQILCRFDKILDVLDIHVLGALRDAEQNGELRSLVVSPYRYADLRTRWLNVGHKLVISNYGDKHDKWTARPLESIDVERSTAALQLPSHVLEFVVEWSGGYPELFTAAIERWSARRTLLWGPALRAELALVMADRVGALIRKLEPPGDTTYLRSVVDLHVGSDAERARLTLSTHPWYETLVGKDGRLRSPVLGDAAIAVLARPSPIVAGNTQTPTSHLWTLTCACYRNGLYPQVLELVRTSPALFDVGVPSLLAAHSRVMAILFPDEREEIDIDVSGAALKRQIGDARNNLSRLSIRIKNRELLTARYNDIESFADALTKAARHNRPVDALAGCHDGEAVNPQVAVVLLLAKLRRATAIRSSTLACETLLPVPEQAFRVWAAWHVNALYNNAPAGEDEVWAKVRGACQFRFDPPAPGEAFGSFELFAKFALSLAIHRGVEILPEPDLGALDRALGACTPRRDAAHALARVTPQARRNFFAVAERWMQCLLAPCTAHLQSYTMDGLFSIVEPLPLVQPNGETEWITFRRVDGS
jgi:hypothetical protein